MLEQICRHKHAVVISYVARYLMTANAREHGGERLLLLWIWNAPVRTRRGASAAVVVIVSTWHARTDSDEARSQCGRSEGWRLDACSNSAWSNNKSHNNGIIIRRMMMTMMIARLEVREEGHGVVTRHVAEQLTQRM